MPTIDFDQETKKLYYSISEVATLFNVNTSLIRFWEKEFDVLNPKKNKKGNRLFTAEDVENLKVIYHLVKEKGFTLEGARKKLEGNRPVLNKEMELENSLLKLRSFLVNLKDQL